MILNKSTFFKVAVISLVIISFFLGYFLKENSVGGGPEFYELSWPIIQSFKKDFLFTIKNYGSFRDYTIPFSHILNAYINPFSNDVENFQRILEIFGLNFIFRFGLLEEGLKELDRKLVLSGQNRLLGCNGLNQDRCKEISSHLENLRF